MTIIKQGTIRKSRFTASELTGPNRLVRLDCGAGFSPKPLVNTIATPRPTLSARHHLLRSLTKRKWSASPSFAASRCVASRLRSKVVHLPRVLHPARSEPMSQGVDVAHGLALDLTHDHQRVVKAAGLNGEIFVTQRPKSSSRLGGLTTTPSSPSGLGYRPPAPENDRPAKLAARLRYALPPSWSAWNVSA